MKLILLVDEKLKASEKKLIDSQFNSYEIKKEDYQTHFCDLPVVDCYILKSTSHWYDWNCLVLKESKVTSVYYSKGKLDDPRKLHTDYVITRFPTQAVSKIDLISRLCFNSLPKPKSNCGLFCGFCLSKITMKTLCSKLCCCVQCL
jgi:hypothetical protein